MVIEVNAFSNCTSLKELHLEKIDQPIRTNIYSKLDNTNISLSIIVSDKLYDEYMSTELVENQFKIVKFSEYINSKILNIDNNNIIVSIIYLQKVLLLKLPDELNNVLNMLIEKLKLKYIVNSDDILKIKNLLIEKEKYGS